MAAAKKHIKIVKKRTSPRYWPPHKMFHFRCYLYLHYWLPIRLKDTTSNITLLILILQALSASIVTRATPTNVSTQIGGSPRVSTTVFEDVSRVKLLCLRYVLVLLCRPLVQWEYLLAQIWPASQTNEIMDENWHCWTRRLMESLWSRLGTVLTRKLDILCLLATKLSLFTIPEMLTFCLCTTRRSQLSMCTDSLFLNHSSSCFMGR